MKRSKHSLSYYKLFTCDMAELIPVACFEVLPGDSVQHATSLLLRVSPLLSPVMHPIQVRIHHWFVPHRLVWEDWEDFITGGSDGDGDGAVYPTVTIPGGGYALGSLPDYFGVPISTGAALTLSALPFRSYNLIFNEYYRDQDLVAELTVPVAGGADITSPLVTQNIAWEKDYFTSARPWPQKGTEITLPLGSVAPVISTGDTIQISSGTVGNQNVQWSDAVGLNAASDLGATGANLFFGAQTGLEADLANATGATLNDVRQAFALQRYQEARAVYGSRYTEYLRYLGVRSSDARLQRPEYLGGGKQTISFSEVLQTAPTTDGDDTEGVGNLKGHGIAAMRSRKYRRFFEEHGLVISLVSVRPRTMYADGIKRMWSRRTKEEYWQKELENIGQQEILNQEVYAAHATPTGVFGYQNRYSEYRHLQSEICGEFRTTLNYWHLARLFGSDPTLNGDFVECDPSKRINAVQDANVLWCMASNSIQARRMVGRGSGIGRIL